MDQGQIFVCCDNTRISLVYSTVLSVDLFRWLSLRVLLLPCTYRVGVMDVQKDRVCPPVRTVQTRNSYVLVRRIARTVVDRRMYFDYVVQKIMHASHACRRSNKMNDITHTSSTSTTAVD